MGKRSGWETAIAIISAMWRERTWSQAALARECGVGTRVVRRHIDDFIRAGWPFEVSDDHPHVYFSLPPSWFPNGIVLEQEATSALLHLLMRVPHSRERTLLLKTATGHFPALAAEALSKVVPPRSSDGEEKHLAQLLDSLSAQTPVQLRYFTASRGALGGRTVSVQRVLVAPPTRFVAFCHTVKALRWFRVDSIVGLSADTAAGYFDADDDEVDSFLDSSVAGYHGGNPIKVAFYVREPEARWVERNLPEGLKGSPEGAGLLVEAETAALPLVARFVVGLGGAAECRTAELAAKVRELAEGALRGSAAG